MTDARLSQPIGRVTAFERTHDASAAPRIGARNQRGRERLEVFDLQSKTAAGVAGEAMVALVLADAFLQKFGGDSLAEMRRNFDNYAQQIDEF